ncbi:MAG: DUF99 family protein [Candidatus Bathyarchaeota archaeon]
MKVAKFRRIKREIRIVGIDDGKSAMRMARRNNLIGAVFRGGEWLDGVLKTKVRVDGFDSTTRIIKMIKTSSHYDQIRIVMLDGLTFAGFNIVNAPKICKELNRPIIVVLKSRNNLEMLRDAVKNLNGGNRKLQLIKNAGEPISVKTKKDADPIYIQLQGIDSEDAKEIVKLASTRSAIPEPIRVANIVASALKTAIH